MTLEMFVAVMTRPQLDTDLDYVRSLCESGTMSPDAIMEHLRDPTSIPLRKMLRAQNHHQEDPSASSATQQQDHYHDRMLDLGAALLSPTPLTQPPPPPPPSDDNILPPELAELLNIVGSDDIIEEAEAEEEAEDVEVIEEQPQHHLLVWSPSQPQRADPERYTWLYTVYMRINGAKMLLTSTHRSKQRDRFLERKIQRFIEAHEDCARYLDALEDPRDNLIDAEQLSACYESLGPSCYARDRGLIAWERDDTIVKHTLRPDPIDVIEGHFPNGAWRVERVAHAIRDGTFPHKQLCRALLEPDGVHEWNLLPEHVLVRPSTHSLYLAMVYILNNCMEQLVMHRETLPPDVRHALWVYYASYTDIFHFCLSRTAQRMDDAFLLYPIGTHTGRSDVVVGESASPWALFGGTVATRTFDADDLPDFMGMLVGIPLWGEMQTPPYVLGKIYHKSLPFACQRRHIIKLVVGCADSTPSFWPVFSKLTWVMMADLYPGTLASPTQRLSMRDLLRIREITDSKKDTQQAFSAGNKDSGGPLVMKTVFRLHILHMASKHTEYVAQARRCVDWDRYRTDAARLADIVRSHRYFSADPFAQARKHLGKTVKSPNSRVHRMHRAPMAQSLSAHLNTTLEKTVLSNQQTHRRDLMVLEKLEREQRWNEELAQTKFGATSIGKALVSAIHRELPPTMPQPVALSTQLLQMLIERSIETTRLACVFYEDVLRIPHRSGIVNALLRTRPEHRLTRDAFAMLTLPELGGASAECVERMCQLVQVYHIKRGVPKEFRKCINLMQAHDFVLACYYLNIASQLDRISFIPLSADTVKRIDRAMLTTRHGLCAGQQVESSMYDVTISLCCERICTMRGQNRFANRKVAFDMERNAFVCANGAHINTNKPSATGSADYTTTTNSASTFRRPRAENDDGDDDDDDDDSHSSFDDDDESDELLIPADEHEQEQDDADLEDIATMLHAFAPSGGGGRGKKASADTTASQNGARKRRKPADPNSETERRKQNRGARKAMSKIPCGQPVVTYSLRGRALIWSVNAEKRIRIMHCERCAALHTYSFIGFSGSEDGHYRCQECARTEITHLPYRTCAYCGPTGTGRVSEASWVEVKCTTTDPTNPHHNLLVRPQDGLQRLHFCDMHYRIARPAALKRVELTKKELWTLIKHKSEARLLSNERIAASRQAKKLK